MTYPPPPLPRLFSDLAWLWPLWGDPAGEYARFSTQVVAWIEQHARRPVHTLLNIACGGGKNIFTLKKHYQVTGLDLSPAMLAQAKTLNPECEFIRGDMRAFALERTFDAILLDDGVSCLTTRADLAAAFQTAFRHLAPGGAMIVTADATTESSRQNRTTVTPAAPGTAPEHLDVVFIENQYDPDPADDRIESTLIYLIRDHGRLRIETDRLVLGLFPHASWRQALATAGFTLHEEFYRQDEDTYPVFICVRPS